MNIFEVAEEIEKGNKIKIKGTNYTLCKYSNIERDWNNPKIFRLLHNHGNTVVCTFETKDCEVVE